MADCENMFENIVNKMYVKFGKLQIEGIHGKGTRNNRSVNPFYASSVKPRVPDDQIPFEHGFNLVNRSVPRVVAQARAGSLNVDSTDNFPKIKSNTVAKHAYTGEITGTYQSENDNNERPRLFSGDTSQNLPPMTSDQYTRAVEEQPYG